MAFWLSCWLSVSSCFEGGQIPPPSEWYLFDYQHVCKNATHLLSGSFINRRPEDVQPYDYLATQKHRYIKCGNFVAMVAKTPQKPAFTPPSLHKKTKICSDGKCQRRPDTGHLTRKRRIYVLCLRKIADPERRSTQERVSQAPVTQYLSPDLGSNKKEGCKSLLIYASSIKPAFRWRQ